MKRAAVLTMALAAVLVGSGCERRDAAPAPRIGLDFGAPARQTVQASLRGARLIAEFGCGSCHTVPGVRGADGRVAPPLDFFGERTYIAGELPNTRENLVRWLLDPPAVEPGTAMPDLGLTAAQARDVAVYLESLR